MSEPRRDPPHYEDDEAADFGAKLKVRLAIAAALVGLALAAIPLLDSLTGKKDSLTDNNAGNIVSSAGLSVAPPAPASAPVASAPASTSSQPVGTAPPGPDVNQTPGMTATPPLTLPAAASPPPVQPAATQHRPTATAAAPQPAAPPRDAVRAFKPDNQPMVSGNQPYRAPGAIGTVPPAIRAATPPAVQQIEPQAPLPAARPSGSSVGYNVQLGLFSNLENAQKLINELKSKGIEVQSETRVHLAPFRTRAEAEQAMTKLRALGYAPMLGVPGSGQ